MKPEPKSEHKPMRESAHKSVPNSKINSKVKSKETSWGSVAKWYDEYLGDADTYQAKVVWPNLNRIISAAVPRGGAVLDLACGQGYFSYLISMLGYTVSGVDIASELIAFAKQKKEVARIAQVDFLPQFHVAPASNVSMIYPKTQDAIVCVLALQNIKELDQTIGECARMLKKNGSFIFVINHPSFRVPQHSDWSYDAMKNVQNRTVSKYMQEATIQIDMTPGYTGNRKNITLSFHRPLQLFVKLLSKHGFAITKLEEWCSHKKTEAGPRKEAEDTARKEIPMFMCIEAKLINS